MKTKLSIVIPCYNEKNNIINIVNKVINSPVENKEIIIVDDMSKDGTREILKKVIAPKVDKIIYHSENVGKGAALKTGFQAISGDIVIIQDADMECDPNDYPTIIEPIISHEADVVYGSRFLKDNKKGYVLNRIANTIITKLSNVFTKQNLTDVETCYKAFKRDILQSVDIEENRFGFDPEITAKVSQMGIEIKEVPISYYPRTKKQGKKIGLKDGLRAIYCIWRYRK